MIILEVWGGSQNLKKQVIFNCRMFQYFSHKTKMLRIDLLVSSVAQSCPTLWDPMDYSPPGFQPITNSCSLIKLMSIKSVIPSNHLIHYRPLLLLSQSFPDQGHFQWVTSSHQVAKVLEFQLQHQSFQWIFKADFL